MRSEKVILLINISIDPAVVRYIFRNFHFRYKVLCILLYVRIGNSPDIHTKFVKISIISLASIMYR